MKHLLLLIILITISFQVCSAQETERPKVGLVLSGGGAKGFAYIGLLKVLEEVNMPIDYIGGSSMGAIMPHYIQWAIRRKPLKN